ncbi:hypothetical protein PWEIH_11350 [Listeria weihenstephanensis FSL R9-0317]|uniref:Uncharacterized protein n=1 Tax=Listeria weihenstephanensis TaxID=1006155 RepID=A0A1S7FV79_9LIST|nr:hypothetical protein [Listeria weihenstephanensis]AQY51302.1 hypothetical protein UE46_09710 [Listeria weihenstephanensis]EUJ36755.1 hypothetical protein PWEIH_11350 [Listeria weihenstephanensis FSL R9-0317]
MDAKSEQIYETLKQLRKERGSYLDKLIRVNRKQAELEELEERLHRMEREKSEILAQSQEVWQGNQGRSVAHYAEDMARAHRQKVTHTMEALQEEVELERKTIQNRLYDMESQEKRLHRELIL